MNVLYSMWEDWNITPAKKEEPYVNGFEVSDEEIEEQAMEMWEEEVARLSRQRDDLLFAGKVKEAEDIECRIAELDQLLGYEE